MPQKRTRNDAAGPPFASALSAVGWVCAGASQAAAASSTVAKIGTRCENRLIVKISCTTALSRATASRRSFGFWREAVINARRPALEIYSTPEKSMTTSAALEVTATSSRA